MAYDIAKFTHIIGVILLIGNVTTTATWKFFADQSRDIKILAFAQRSVTLTDWSLTTWGAGLTIVGGYAAVLIGKFDPLSDMWLVLGQGFFLVSGLVWLFILIPLQVKMASLSRAAAISGALSDAYRRANRKWFVFGIAATIPLVAALWVMIVKPT